MNHVLWCLLRSLNYVSYHPVRSFNKGLLNISEVKHIKSARAAFNDYACKSNAIKCWKLSRFWKRIKIEKRLKWTCLDGLFFSLMPHLDVYMGRLSSCIVIKCSQFNVYNFLPMKNSLCIEAFRIIVCCFYRQNRTLKDNV